ncbi:MAG: acyltransferase family protein [Acidocella sp.]|uniref:acyltransferase family protein n=1 Tax=Acidocella sp. TaxID=50710 RepID=UPI003FD81C9F
MTETRHYLALDGLRGVAALAVVSLHVTEYFRLPVQPGHAYLAVDFFFMLSGFVIAHAYDEKLRWGMGVLPFLAVRLIRLQPLVLLGVALGTGAYLLRARLGGIDMASVLQAACTNALLLPTPALLALRPWAFPVDTPLWSLAFEIWINVLYALLFRVLTRLTLGMGLVIGAGLVISMSLANGGLNEGFAWHGFYLGGARVLFPFVMGVMLSRYARGEARLGWAHAMFIPLLLVLCAPVAGGGWFDIAAVLLAFPALLLAASRASVSQRLDSLWRQLGLLSYPVYVIHYPFVVVISNLCKSSHAGVAASWLGAMVTILVVLVLSALAARFYDAPVRAWASRRLAPPLAAARAG